MKTSTAAADDTASGPPEKMENIREEMEVNKERTEHVFCVDSEEMVVSH